MTRSHKNSEYLLEYILYSENNIPTRVQELFHSSSDELAKKYAKERVEFSVQMKQSPVSATPSVYRIDEKTKL